MPHSMNLRAVNAFSSGPLAVPAANSPLWIKRVRNIRCHRVPASAEPGCQRPGIRGDTRRVRWIVQAQYRQSISGHDVTLPTLLPTRGNNFRFAVYATIARRPAMPGAPSSREARLSASPRENARLDPLHIRELQPQLGENNRFDPPTPLANVNEQRGCSHQATSAAWSRRGSRHGPNIPEQRFRVVKPQTRVEEGACGNGRC